MLQHRLLSATGLLLIVALMVFWRSPWAAAVFLAFGGTLLLLALREYFAITAKGGIRGWPRLTMAVGALHLLGIGLLGLWSGGRGPSPLLAEILLFTSFMALGFARVAYTASDFEREFRHFVVSLAGYGYLVWTLGFMAKVYFIEGSPATGNGPFLLLYLILVTKSGDIGGYALGKSTAMRAQGNHKIIPRVSPGKSWEGLAGSIALSVLVSWLLWHFLGDRLTLQERPLFNAWTMAIMGVALAVIGLLGDLSESLIKRAFGVKDSGAVLPGLGGALDAVDSLILVAPLFYCYVEASRLLAS